MTTAAIDQAFLERTVTSLSVARYFDDDGDGAADAAILTDFLSRATSRAYSLLYASFPRALVQALGSDERFKDCIARIAIGLACERKPEWQRDNGKYPFAEQWARAEEELKLIAKGEQRLADEETAGANRTLGGSTSPRLPVDPVFAPSRKYPGGRGSF